MPKSITLEKNEKESSISKNELGVLIAAYRTERLNKLPAELRDDTTSVWISKAKLNEVLTRNSDCTGIRFYFGTIEDPFVDYKVHNLILVSTRAGKEDQLGEDNAVLITRNIPKTAENASDDVDAVICPPPTDRCTGKSF